MFAPSEMISHMGRRKAVLAVPGIIILFLYFFILPRDPLRSSAPHLRNKIQYAFHPGTSYAQPARLNAVKRELVHAWDSYVDHGFMADSMGPLTGGTSDNFCGWSATLVDALDTLYIAGLHDEFDLAVDSLQHIDFADPDNTCVVNFFEVVIRHLGGLLAAYDLSLDRRILPKLVELGDVLHRAFSTMNGMPCSHCALMANPPPYMAPPSIALAAQGTLSLEFARLSQITGNPIYFDSIMKVTNALARTQNDSTIPGLWPENVDASSVEGEGTDRRFSRINHLFSVGALSDSTYEYLVKGHLLLGGNSSIFHQMWELASPQIKNVILFRAQIPGAEKEDLLFTGRAIRKKYQNIAENGIGDVDLDAHMEHLSCYAGGMYALSSRIFGDPEDLEIAAALTNGCVWAYRNSPLGIMAEAFKMLPCDFVDTNETNIDTENGDHKPPTSLVQKQCKEDPSVWEPETYTDPITNATSIIPRALPPGFLRTVNSAYFLRPEAIESVFYMYRITGDDHWRDVGWSMFRAIQEYTWAPYGHAAIADVFQPVDEKGFLRVAPSVPGPMGVSTPATDGGNGDKGSMIGKSRTASSRSRPTQKDEMESFWFGETLKYFYLLFAEPSLVSLDEFVLNTEAHPFRLTGGVRGFG